MHNSVLLAMYLLRAQVEYELKHPEHKSLNRMKVLNYLDKYGPEDAWIGKTIYR